MKNILTDGELHVFFLVILFNFLHPARIQCFLHTGMPILSSFQCVFRVLQRTGRTADIRQFYVLIHSDQLKLSVANRILKYVNVRIE